MPPRTIDNLGVDVSTRWAEDQKYLDEKLVKESRGIQTQTEIEVTIPSFPSELEALVRSQTTFLTWALFIMPLRYNEQKKRLFTFQLIPSLGSDEKKESQTQKILAKLRARADRRKEQQEKGQGQSQQEKWHEEKEAEEEENEKKTLISLLDTITTYDKFLVDINSRRSQYQKG
ncbi:MAG: DUF5399 family protein [Rhabdochlamydiaceae bacterium]|nr:DUF5399 family protein [Rhabdochlamydiaceae bacterium]